MATYASVESTRADEEALREEIIAFIEERLGEDLAKLYGHSIRSSVGTGCYDRDFQTPDKQKIEDYLEILYADWAGKHDAGDLLYRVLHLLEFGSDQDKEQLRELLQLP